MHELEYLLIYFYILHAFICKPILNQKIRSDKKYEITRKCLASLLNDGVKIHYKTDKKSIVCQAESIFAKKHFSLIDTEKKTFQYKYI